MDRATKTLTAERLADNTEVNKNPKSRDWNPKETGVGFYAQSAFGQQGLAASYETGPRPCPIIGQYPFLLKADRPPHHTKTHGRAIPSQQQMTVLGGRNQPSFAFVDDRACSNSRNIWRASEALRENRSMSSTKDRLTR